MSCFLSSVKMASIYQTAIEQELGHLATQASSFLDRLYPAGKLTQVTAVDCVALLNGHFTIGICGTLVNRFFPITN